MASTSGLRFDALISHYQALTTLKCSRVGRVFEAHRIPSKEGYAIAKPWWASKTRPTLHSA